jgi:hypothetical protein
MLPADSIPSPDADRNSGLVEATDSAASSAALQSGLRPRGSLRFWAVLIAATCLAATLSWLITETRLVRVLPRRERFVAVGKTIEGIPVQAREHATVVTAARVHLVAGAMLGLVLGFLGGRSRHSRGAAVLNALMGLVLGTIGGGLVSYWGMATAQRMGRTLADASLFAMGVRAAIWGSLGGCAGLALGIGQRQITGLIRSLLGGALGGALAAVVYEVLVAVLFPMEPTSQFISSLASARLMALMLLSIFSATGAALALGPAEPER